MQILSDLNSWIVGHKELLTVIGVPTITLLVTTLVNQAAEKRASKERQVERELSREMKLADFRQLWISELREEFSNVLAFAGSSKASPSELRQVNALISRILLRMNPDEPLAQEVFDSMLKVINFTGSDKEANELNLKATNAMNLFLKSEWERLKNDLRETEGVGKK